MTAFPLLSTTAALKIANRNSIVSYILFLKEKKKANTIEIYW